MLWRQLFCLLLSVTCLHTANAARYTYEYNDNCGRAYQYYLSLHIQEARANVINEIKANPYNLMAVYISDYEDCILLLLNCDRAEYRQRESHLDERMELLEKGDRSSPWFRFCKAGVYLHWAIIHMRFGEQFGAAASFRKSFALLKENQRMFPDFRQNAIFAGLEEAVVGSLPGNFKWLASIFGMKGDVKKGTAKLAEYVKTRDPHDAMYTETVLYYLYTRFYLLQQQKEVWDYLADPQFSNTFNLLNVYVKANLAIDYRKGDAALEALKAAATEPNFATYPVFDYQAGMALLNKMDTGCIFYFQQYLKKNKSDLYIKDCWQKMALSYYLAGNMPQATYCRQQISSNGTARIDADKQAAKFGDGDTWPFKKLLEARLLIEGGYYSQALKALSGIDTNGITNPADKSEYYFRFGRIYEESEQYAQALAYYQLTIHSGKDRHEQFAARAALHMGKVYEHTAKPGLAIKHYQLCLDMPAHDFQNSIDQQAKAGINRVQGK